MITLHRYTTGLACIVYARDIAAILEEENDHGRYTRLVFYDGRELTVGEAVQSVVAKITEAQHAVRAG